MSGIKHSFAYVIGLITMGVIVGVVLTTGFNVDSKTHAEGVENKIYQESSSETTGSAVTVANFNPNSMFVENTKKVRPSIVSIYTTKNVKVSANPFHFFFRDMPMPQGSEMPQKELKEHGLGSGIIISKDGYILTNNHVIQDMDEVKVKLIDNSEYKAKIIGRDPSTEIALIKIDAHDLPVAILGNSDNLQIGEWVMAIGNPLELTSTVTAGIVSALHREIDISRRNGVNGIENFIQTDAAINPGNSGGALINLKGEVIGVNTAIATGTNYYVGYGFAVPINIAKNVVDDLIKYGEVKRGYLGVYIAPVDPVTAKGVGLEKPEGVFITSVIKGSAGDDAGIQEGDVVLTVDGKKVNKPNQLQAKVGMHHPGEKVELTIWRDGKVKNITVILRGRDNEETTVVEKKKSNQKEMPDVGMKVRDLTKRQLDRLELDGGALVVAVEEDGPAAHARISQGDVIMSLNGKTVESADDFYDMISDFDSGSVIRLKLRRKQGNDLFDRLVFLQIPEK